MSETAELKRRLEALEGKPQHFKARPSVITIALGIAAMLAVQLGAMRVLLRDPEGKTPWYQGMGILFYISGMMIAAVALRSVGG